MLVKIKKLDMFYGDFQALNNVNMDINKNEITAFIGPSGCGKSTLLRCINRMHDLYENNKIIGDILINDKNILDEDTDVIELREYVGMVFQKANPFPKSIYENVIFGPKRHGITKKSILDDLVEESLRDAALWDEVKDRLKDDAFSLSGGQQQRLCIARCLAMKPKLLLMDEPTSALDPIATYKIEDMLIKLKEKYSIVIVTHSMNQAARISDKVGFFLNGEVIEFDKTENIFNSPMDKRTEDYITGRFG